MATSGITRSENDFILKSFDVYQDDDTNPTYYARGEKTISFSPEFAEFVEGVPSSLVRKDLTRFGMAVAFTAVSWTAKGVQTARGGEYVEGLLYEWVYYGTDYAVPSTHKWTFVSENVNSKAFELVILKGAVSEYPDIVVGGGDYAELGFVIEATKDTTEADASRDLAYFRFEK